LADEHRQPEGLPKNIVARDDDNGPNGPNGDDERPPPRIDRITPAAGAREFETITIAGANLKLAGEATTVTFTVGASSAASPSVTGTATQLRVEVPRLSAHGPAAISVRTTNGEAIWAATRGFVVNAQPAAVVADVQPRVAAAGDTNIKISGSGFGATARTVQIGTQAPIGSWRDNEITVTVPALNPGDYDVVVRVPWNEARAPAKLTVIPLPTIAPPAQIAPGGLLILAGSAFGDQRGTGSLSVSIAGASAAAEIISWRADEIRAWLPGQARLPLRTRDRKAQITVTRNDGRQASATVTVGDRASITTYVRLEPRARDVSLEQGLERGLQARIYDAAWLLARQWQLGEFQGEDNGSPISARIDTDSALLTRFAGGTATPPAPTPYDPTKLPLEALVEREPPALDPAHPGLAAEAGLTFLRTLRTRITDAAAAARYTTWFTSTYPLQTPAQGSQSSRRISVFAGRVPDGVALYNATASGLPSQLQVPPADKAALAATVSDWRNWYDRSISRPADERPSWRPDRLEYTFALGGELQQGGEIVLRAPDYAGERLDWHSFDIDPTSLATIPAAKSLTLARSLIPTRATYPGMPALRWWQFEDARVNLGQVKAGPTELLHMLLIEFATIFGNDWFVLPLDRLPVGSATRIAALKITDTFGTRTDLAPFDTTGTWRMFEPSADGNTTKKLLIVPPTAATPLSSEPIERVLVLRDELANLAWAIERVVEDPAGRPADRLERYHAELATADSQAPPPPTITNGEPSLRYQLATSVPDFWIPLVPVRLGDSTRLQRGILRQIGPDGKQHDTHAEGRILTAANPLVLYEEEAPREPIEVTRSYQYGRWSDGTSHLWIGRSKQPGPSESSSGLRFDVVDHR
jgi:IPT/TIG domain